MSGSQKQKSRMKEQVVWRWRSLERKCLYLLQQTNITTPHSLLQIHAKFITSSSHLIQHARRLFHHQPNNHDIPRFSHSFSLYRDLRRGDTGFEPDGYTFTALAKSCGFDGDIFEGEEIHCHAFKAGLCLDLFVSTSLVDMYVKLGRMGCARKVFDQMTERNRVSWTALICGYARAGDMGTARRLFEEMPERDSVAFNALIDGYAKLGEMGFARSLFDEMTGRNVVTWTSMIYGYCLRGDVEAAKSLFDSMPKKNLVSWNVMIGGYCQNKQPREAVGLFREMQLTTSLEPNAVTIVSILPAIADLGALDLGRWVHEFVQRKKLDRLTNVCTALVDMYAKCGEITRARRVFDEMPEKETASWNALINGLAVNGHGKEALEAFLDMQRENFKPNNITLICWCSVRL